jgi:hypothetical protein
MEGKAMGVRIEGLEGTMAYIQRQAQKRLNNYIKSLERIGLETVRKIRTKQVSNWDDKSTNLRSSIGYLLLCDGKIVGGNFALSSDHGQEGLAAGKKYAYELAGQYPTGFVLIIVAGMNYAAYVEAVEGKTVLAGGELYARKALEEVLRKFNKR